MLSALVVRMLSMLVVATLGAAVNSSSRFYEAATTVSAGAFDLQVANSEARGKYLYTYLAPNVSGPKVVSMIYDVRIEGPSIAFRDASGRECRSWSLRHLTAYELSVVVGTAAATYKAVQRKDYEKQVKALKSTADALRGHGGGLIDSLKPLCPD